MVKKKGKSRDYEKDVQAQETHSVLSKVRLTDKKQKRQYKYLDLVVELLLMMKFES